MPDVGRALRVPHDPASLQSPNELFGERSYAFADDWLQMPDGLGFRSAAAVAIDARDTIYVVGRTPGGERSSAVFVISPDGELLDHWAHEMIGAQASGLEVAPDGSLYVTDWGRHFVGQFSPAGELLDVLGTPDVPADAGIDPSFEPRDGFGLFEQVRYGGGPFGGPTDLAFHPNGDFYVSDGYRNARVHRFGPDNELRASWAEPGLGPGQLMNPKSLTAMADGSVIVADRENYRLQIFTPDGRFLREVRGPHRPSAVAVDPVDGSIAVTEIEFNPSLHRSFVHSVEVFLPARFSVFDATAERLIHRQVLPTYGAGMCAPHGLALDSGGNVYIGSTAHFMYSLYFDETVTDAIPANAGVLWKLNKNSPSATPS